MTSETALARVGTQLELEAAGRNRERRSSEAIWLECPMKATTCGMRRRTVAASQPLRRNYEKADSGYRRNLEHRHRTDRHQLGRSEHEALGKYPLRFYGER